MHTVVVTGAHLPQVLVGAVLGCDVEDGFELSGRYIVSQELRTGGLLDVQHVRTGVAPVPALGTFPAQRVGRSEERTQVRHLTAALAVTEERWPSTAVSAIEAEKDEDGVAAHMVVHFAPVGVAHVPDAVAACAVGGIGDASALCEIGRRERESAALGNEALDLGSGQCWPHLWTRARCDEAPLGLGEGRHRRGEQREDSQHSSSRNMMQRHLAVSPFVGKDHQVP